MVRMSENESEEERMAREISQEEERHHGPARQERREYHGYKPVEMHRQAGTEEISRQIASQQPAPRGEIHLKHSFAHSSGQALRSGISDIGRGIQGVGQAAGGLYHKYEGWQAQRRQKELENRPYEEYKYHKKMREIVIKSREEALNQQRLRGSGGFGGMARGIYGGSRSRGYASQGGFSNPFASWGIGQQQQGAPKSYEYARSGAPRRYERSEESIALAQRARELKTRSRQLRKIARRERALANREARMEQEAIPKQQGGGFGHELFGHWKL
jgi:hypothetical protein